MNVRSLLTTVCIVILLMAGASFAYALGAGEPNPLFFAIRCAIGIVSSTVALAVIAAYGPVFIVILRGVRREFEDWMVVGDWGTAFSSRSAIRRAETLRLVQTAHPKVSDDLHDWFGADARRVFRAVSKAADFKGGKYRIAAWLESIRAANIRDFDTLIGYIEVAGVEPAVFAMQEDMPIEYAKPLFVVG